MVKRTPARPRRILVCDDDPLLLDLVAHRLTTRGFEVNTAQDGSEALEQMARELPDALVLDAMMPVIDGYELLRRVREEPRTAGLPVLMLTARKQEKDVLAALDLGANDYLVKPFIPQELVVRLERLMGQVHA
ncbi:MAG TPA: response regulator [Allosphingosinicella sp.]|nr:response regulator [Allosphingosinicella sp.]